MTLLFRTRDKLTYHLLINAMSDIQVKELNVDGYTQFVASVKLVCGRLVSISSSCVNSAIAELEEEVRYLSNNNSYNPNQGISFDEDEDYYC